MIVNYLDLVRLALDILDDHMMPVEVRTFICQVIPGVDLFQRRNLFFGKLINLAIDV